MRQGSSKRVYATSLEKHYPLLLCEAIVHAFILKLSEIGLKFSDKTSLQHASRAATALQSKSLKLPPLVSPYKSKIVILCKDCEQVWPAQPADLRACKLLHEFSLGGNFSVDQLLESHETLKRLETELAVWNMSLNFQDLRLLECNFNEVEVYGVRWEPLEFAERACEVHHPLSPDLALPKVLADSISFMANSGLHAVAKRRAEFFKKWNHRVQDLEKTETALRATMDAAVETAVRGKRIALFSEMLDFYEFPDKGVLDELQLGASLTGDVAETGMLPFKFTPAVLTRDALRLQSELRRRTLLLDPKGSGDAEVDKEVWNQTLEEKNKGWLIGPIPHDKVPADAPISKRFGLRQKHKIRLIDDFSESSVNGTVTVFESPVLHTVDVACAAILHWFSCSRDAGMDPKLVARTFDLSSAYRQVGLSQEGRRVAFIRVFDPTDGTWKIFQAQVLPFGAIKSVHSFLRLARAIWWLGVVGCCLFWSSFFDDYIVFSPPPLARSSELSAAALFKLLGWIFAEEGRKCMPFGETCEALGVIFDLSSSDQFICKVSNTASRVEEISGEIQRLLDTGFIMQAEAQKIRGRMQFAESQIYGRTGKRCIACLRDFASRRRTKISLRDATFLKLFLSLIKSDEPRIVSLQPPNSIILITDACYERESRELICGLGGTLIDTFTGTKKFFSCELTSDQRNLLGEQNKKQIIFEAETLCAILAYALWSECLKDRMGFLYVDNEGTKFSLMKGMSENATVDAMAQVFAEIETHVRTLCWISRVSSFSNIADAPSRGDCEVLRKLAFQDVSEEAQKTLERICISVKIKLGKTAEQQIPFGQKCVTAAGTALTNN